MNRLYALALLLTGEHGAAEACFVAALEDCRTGPEVFRESAQAWSRRAIVKQAIRRVRPRPEVPGSAASAQVPRESIASLLFQLTAFDRFVFAMTVLERYSHKESALLLDCRLTDIEAARKRALQFIAAAGRNAVPPIVTATQLEAPAAVA